MAGVDASSGIFMHQVLKCKTAVHCGDSPWREMMTHAVPMSI